MANGNTEVIKEMREIIKDGRKVDIETRDRLLFSAIIDIYQKLEEFSPALIYYKVSVWLISAIAIALIGLAIR